MSANKSALNLLKNEKPIRLGVKNKRLKAGWDNTDMLVNSDTKHSESLNPE